MADSGTPLDSLKVVIKGDSEDAVNKIDALISKLTSISQATQNTNKGLTSYSSAIKKISAAMSDADGNKIVAMSNALAGLSSLNNVKISSTIPKRISEIGAAVEGVDISKVEKLVQSLSGLQGLGAISGANLSGISNATNAAPAAENNFSGTVEMSGGTQTGEIKDTTAAIEGQTKTVEKNSSAWSKLRGIASKAASGIGNAVSAPFKKIGSAISNLTKVVKKRVLYRAINAVISGITKSIKEGVNNIYQYSNAVGTAFAPNMDKIATATLYLKNSLGALAAPLINAIAPAIDFVIDKVVDFINIFSQAIARLTGASTWSKAVKYPTTYASATDKAAAANKKFKASLLGIDEINKLSDNSDDSGSSGGNAQDYSKMFAEISVDNSQSLASSLGGSFNKAINDTNWAELGQKLSEKTVGIFTFAGDLVRSVDWLNLGASIAEFINNVDVAAILASLGTLISNLVVAALQLVTSFIGNLDFKELGHKLIVGIKKMLSNIDWSEITRLIFLSLAQSLVVPFDFGWGLVSGIYESIVDAINSIKDYYTPYIEEAGGNVGKGFLNGTLDALGDIGKWVKDNIITPFLEGLGFSKEDVQGFYDSIDNFFSSLPGKVSEKWQDLKKWLKENVNVGEWFTETLPTWFEELPTKITEFFDKIKEKIKNVDWRALGIIAGQKLADVVVDTDEWISKTLTSAKEFLEEKISKFITETLPTFINEKLPKMWEKIKTFFSELPTKIKDAITNAATKLYDIGKAIIDGIWTGLQTVWQALKDFVNSFLLGFNFELGIKGKSGDSEAFRSTGNGITNGLLKGIKDKWNSIPQYFSEKLTDIKNKFSSAWSDIKTKAANSAQDVWNAIKDKFTSVGTFFKDTFTKAWNKVKEVFSSTGDITLSIKAGVSSVFTDVANKIIEGFNNVIALPFNGINNIIYKLKEFSILGKKPFENLNTITVPQIPQIFNAERTGGGRNFGHSGNGYTYAEGGFPTIGEMFIARESGAELVGQIGNRTAVVNNDQIVESVSGGVAEANREQNSILYDILDVIRVISRKDYNAGSTDIFAEISRRNRQDGTTIIPMGV